MEQPEQTEQTEQKILPRVAAAGFVIEDWFGAPAMAESRVAFDLDADGLEVAWRVAVAMDQTNDARLLTILAYDRFHDAPVAKLTYSSDGRLLSVEVPETVAVEEVRGDQLD